MKEKMINEWKVWNSKKNSHGKKLSDRRISKETKNYEKWNCEEIPSECVAWWKMRIEKQRNKVRLLNDMEQKTKVNEKWYNQAEMTESLLTVLNIFLLISLITFQTYLFVPQSNYIGDGAKGNLVLLSTILWLF